jgi:hypothetical protein
VKAETATTLVEAVFRFMPFAALWTGLRGIPLILQLNFHAQSFSFVREHLSSLSMQHLMDLLIRFFAIIDRFPNISDVANHNGLHPSIVEGGNKFCRLFVLNIFDLIIQLC